ncbi:MAG: J domain-containing protein [Alphaproteobacteria bacterium]
MADRDPYEVLGVEKTASQEAIRRAYRALAKKHHPDLNPGDAEAERLFKEAANANAILSDPEQRARYDRGEIDAAGHERPEPAHAGRSGGFGGGFARHGGDEGFMAQEGFASEEELQAFLNEMFAARSGGARPGAGGRRRWAARGADLALTVTVPFIEACLGGKRRIAVPNRTPLDVSLPPGIADGGTVRLAGQGEPGYDGGPPGDLFVQVHVAPHRFFERRDADIHLELPVTVAEAVLGAAVRAPTIHGPVDVKVPAGAKAGTRLRLRGKGVPDGKGGFGDQYVRIAIAAPEKPDQALKDALAAWAKRSPENPRKDMEAGR